MQQAGAPVAVAPSSEDARLESLGYKPQLNRVLGLFSNFAVAFTYLSPMVGSTRCSSSASGRVGRPTCG